MRAAILTTMTLLFSGMAQAQNYYTCQLSALPGEAAEYMEVTGSLSVLKSAAGQFTLSVNGKVTFKDESFEKLDIRVEGAELKDGHMTAEQVLKSEVWEVLEGEFKGEKPTGAHFFQTPGFEENGAGDALMVVHGDKDTKMSLVYLGWFHVLCR